MNALNLRSTTGIATLSLSAVIFCFSLPALSDNAPTVPAEASSQQAAPRGDFCSQQRGQHARLVRGINARLDKMAERLEIRASQQGAWATYRAMVIGLADTSGLTRPAADADAATLLRYRAERTGEMAQKLAKLAEATSTLQTILAPEQRAVLDEMTHRLLDMEGRRGQRIHVPGQ
jgi:LTXXQ motif family protein